jgi:hypothetical protein
MLARRKITEAELRSFERYNAEDLEKVVTYALAFLCEVGFGFLKPYHLVEPCGGGLLFVCRWLWISDSGKKYGVEYELDLAEIRGWKDRDVAAEAGTRHARRARARLANMGVNG